jgi:hypothetical protein
MPITYATIATTTLSSPAASITFSSIPATYTDLRLTLTALSSSGSTVINGYIIFNNDSGANYSWTNLRGTGTAIATNNFASSTQINLNFLSNATSTIPYFVTADIFSYANSTFKTILTTSSGDQNGSGAIENHIGRWASTSAINRLDLYTNAVPNFGIGTTASLYGIKNA